MRDKPSMSSELAKLPQVQTVLEMSEAKSLIARFSRQEVLGAVRAEIELLRRQVLSGALRLDGEIAGEAFFTSVSESIELQRLSNLRPVINATGIIVHTNLGRAPLAPEALNAIRTAAAGYSNLEFDLESGQRGKRQAHVEALLCELTGAEAALVLNNCSGAVVASLNALAVGKTVLASRGELVEIGGSFRMPDVIAGSGARLKEVGATNKTHLSDYADAIDSDTAVLLKSHTSNFKMVGFTTAPARADLAALARKTDTIFIEDLGSGVLVDLGAFGLPDEPVVGDVVAAGADIIMFSGDKLLGGPQAGIIVGKAEHVARIAKHAMARAMRIDKLSLAGLEATLRLYLPPHDPVKQIPVLRMLAEPVESVRARAEQVAGALTQLLGAQTVVSIDTEAMVAFAGGGSLPEQDLQSYGLRINDPRLSAQDISGHLRALPIPIIGRIKSDTFLLDMRTVSETETQDLIDGLITVLAP